jgi:hypothetical protein
MKRIYHTWDEWECYPAGFYDNYPKDRTITDDQAKAMYAEMLADMATFKVALDRVLAEWPTSCEHYLSNERMNRIAWLGQASLCIMLGIPSRYRGGYQQLTDEQKVAGDAAALEALNRWLVAHGESELSIDEAKSKTEMDLY